MSDPVTKAEAEDVLSSIRRLVREQDGDQNVPAQKARRKPGRLLLTPALRIADTSEGRKLARAPLVLGRAQQVADSADHAATRQHDTGSGNSAHQSFENRSQPEPSPVAATPEEKAIGKPGFDDGVIRVEPAISLSAKIEALEAVIAQTDDQWEPDGEGTDAYAGTRTGTMEWDEDDRLSLSESGSVEEPSEPARPVPYVLENEPVTDEEYRPAAKVADGALDDDFYDYDDEDMLDADYAQVAEAVIDEEALRQLVVDIVREELQGPLGERITRNVRKLVRREIHRALDSQDLE